MVRKILSLLFSIAFLLVFVSFFSQKSLATAVGSACNNALDWTNTCSDDGQRVLSCKGPTWNITKDCPIHTSTCSNSTHDCVAACDSTCQSQHCFTAIQYCTSTGATYVSANNHFCPSGQYYCDLSTAPGGAQSTSGIPNGARGCSFKIPANINPNTITTIPPEDMLISCQNKGVCTPDTQSSVQMVNGGAVALVNGLCLSTDNQCPVCDSGYQYTNEGDCVSITDYTKRKPLVGTDSCTDTQGCDPGIGCVGRGTTDTTSQVLSLCNNGVSCPTALGDLPTNLPGLLTRVFSIALGLAGVVALGLIIASGYRLMISQGNPEQVKGAREQLTAAIVGLLFIIFSLVILQIIGANILGIPGFGK